MNSHYGSSRISNVQTSALVLIVLNLVVDCATGFQSFKLPQLDKIFPGTLKTPTFGIPTVSSTANKTAQDKAELLRAISNTANGKNATPTQQKNVLDIVRKLELSSPPVSTILTDPAQSAILDGVWYLQYTSPSIIEGTDQDENVWKPSLTEDKIEIKQVKNQGSVSATGLTVDVSKRIVKQTFDISQSKVFNEVTLDFGKVFVGGTFRPSDKVYNRALVSFKESKIDFNFGFTLKLGFIFSIIAALRGTEDNGWLETTFVDDEVRIGRGNKGTMFVLTRDATAVVP